VYVLSNAEVKPWICPLGIAKPHAPPVVWEANVVGAAIVPAVEPMVRLLDVVRLPVVGPLIDAV